MTAIEFENVSKQYRLGLVSTGTLSHDLNRFWQTKVLGRDDPYLKIGETNDRSTKGTSDYVWALKDIDFKVEQGDVVGIIGRNGAGKSTLLKLLSRVTAPTTGVIRARGRIASLLEVGTGFHPEMTGRENIFMNGSIMGMSHDEIVHKLDEIVDFSGCERYLDTPVKRYSSGMTVRLGFAIAAHLEPEILVVDEVLAVGDAEFQKKAVGKMQDVSRGEGRTVLFVSHNMRAVRNLCKSSIVLDNGKVLFRGEAEKGISFYLQLASSENKNLSVSDAKRSSSCSGKIRFTDLKLLDEDDNEGKPRCGKTVVMRISYRAFEDCTNCQLAISFCDLYGNRVLVIPSDLTIPNFSVGKGDHSIELILPRLTLSPGDYLLALGFWENGATADFLEYSQKITVLDDDFYGTGKMIGSMFAGKVVLCDHKWRFV